MLKTDFKSAVLHLYAILAIRTIKFYTSVRCTHENKSDYEVKFENKNKRKNVSNENKKVTKNNQVKDLKLLNESIQNYI